MAKTELIELTKNGITRTPGTAAEQVQMLAQGWRKPDQIAAARTKQLEDLKVDELRSHATENHIDLAGATKKPDLIAAIVAHETTPPADTPAEQAPPTDA